MKVGDYIRVDGYISKIGHIRQSSSGKIYVQWKQPNGMLASGNINVIEKMGEHPSNVIKIGDILTIKDTLGNISKVEVDESFKLYSGKIVSIVTKEQFKRMEYRLDI